MPTGSGSDENPLPVVCLLTGSYTPEGARELSGVSFIRARIPFTLPTKIHLVKAVVFLVVMYRCESWTIKKTEGQRTDAFEF